MYELEDYHRGNCGLLSTDRLLVKPQGLDARQELHWRTENMFNQKRPLRVLSLVLIPIGCLLEVLSCSSGILRDGRSPIAAMLALVGIFAIVAGCISSWSFAGPMMEARRVRLCLMLEHFLGCSIGGIFWLMAEREVFFGDAPYGHPIKGICTQLVGVFLGASLLGIILRFSVCAPRRSSWYFRLSPISTAAWRALAVSFVACVGLNLVEGVETFYVKSGLVRFVNGEKALTAKSGFHVSIHSRGFPFPQEESIQILPNSSDGRGVGEPLAFELTLPDESTVLFDRAGVTFRRLYREKIELGPEEAAVLPNGTRIRLQNSMIYISRSGRKPIVADLKGLAASFEGGVARIRYNAALPLDILLGFLLAVHLATCIERLHRVVNDRSAEDLPNKAQVT